MIKRNNIVTILLVLSFIVTNIQAQIIRPKKYDETIRIACVGNSITYGYELEDRDHNSYPAKLGKFLGKDFEVRNYGYSARTLLKKGDLPWTNEQMFKDALHFKPHVVIIMLGTNDTKPHNWVHKEDFKSDYKALVTAFDTLETHPKIVICELVPAFPDRWGINDSTIVNEVNPLIVEIGKELRIPVIDMYTPFKNKAALFPDRIHPNIEGADLMARIIYEYLVFKKKDRKYVLSSSYGSSK